MAWMLPAAVGANAVASIIGGNAAASGAKAQAKAMSEYNNILKNMLTQQESISKPFRESLYPALQKALGIESYDIPAVTKQVPNWSWDTNSMSMVNTPETVTVTPETTGYRQIAGYDPTQAMSDLPAYAASRTPLETQYNTAKENILSSTPTGATGALARSLAGLETSRAESIGNIPYNLYSGLYNSAMGLAAGNPNLTLGAVNQMQQGSGNLLNYYGQQYSTNMQNLGAMGQGLGYALYNHYNTTPTGSGSGGTTGLNPFMFNGYNNLPNGFNMNMPNMYGAGGL